MNSGSPCSTIPPNKIFVMIFAVLIFNGTAISILFRSFEILPSIHSKNILISLNNHIQYDITSFNFFTASKIFLMSINVAKIFMQLNCNFLADFFTVLLCIIFTTNNFPPEKFFGEGICLESKMINAKNPCCTRLNHY